MDQFTIYADKRLQRRMIISDIAKLFGIAESDYVVRSDHTMFAQYFDLYLTPSAIDRRISVIE